MLAVPPPEAATLLAGVDQELAGLLGGIPMAPVAVASLGFRDRLASLPDGFGFLAPRDEGSVRWVCSSPRGSSRAGPRAAATCSPATSAGCSTPGRLNSMMPRLTGLVRTDLARLTGRVGRARSGPGGPAPHGHPPAGGRPPGADGEGPGRLDRLPGLHLAGNYLRGVGIKDAVASGLEAAEAVLRQSPEQRAAREAVA